MTAFEEGTLGTPISLLKHCQAILCHSEPPNPATVQPEKFNEQANDSILVLTNLITILFSTTGNQSVSWRALCWGSICGLCLYLHMLLSSPEREPQIKHR